MFTEGYFLNGCGNLPIQNHVFWRCCDVLCCKVPPLEGSSTHHLISPTFRFPSSTGNVEFKVLLERICLYDKMWKNVIFSKYANPLSVPPCEILGSYPSPAPLVLHCPSRSINHSLVQFIHGGAGSTQATIAAIVVVISKGVTAGDRAFDHAAELPQCPRGHPTSGSAHCKKT